MKRTLSLFLALVLVFSFGMAFAEGEKPVISVMTIKAGAALPDGVTVDSSDYLARLEEMTGFDIEWSCFNEGSADELRLLLAGGNVADLLQFNSSSVVTDLARSGGVAELDESLAAYGQDLLAFYPDYVLDTGKVDGKQYWLMRFKQDAYVGTMGLRKDVLDELNMDVPTDIQGWEDLLAAVKEKTSLTPLLAGNGMRYFTNFAHAMDVPVLDVQGFFLIENGECVMPIFTENGYAFIEKMHQWYEAGYIDSEFLVRDDQMDQFLAGNGFSMFIDYTQVARNIPTFYETNPDGEVVFVEPPVSENGLRGVTCGNLNVGMNWFVPASKADKTDVAIQFLNACLSEDVINLICYGVEGENWEDVNGVPTFNRDNMPADYRGYYSRVVLDGTFDEAWEASMNVWDLCRTLTTYTNTNEIGSVPSEGCDTYFEMSGEINSYIRDEIMRMIVEGIDEDAFETLKDDVMGMGAADIIEELNAWQSAK